MKKILITAMLILVFAPAAMAASAVTQPGTYQASKNINVRLFPRAGSLRIDHLHKDQEIKVKRVVKGWCEIEYKKYWHAYVDCSFLAAVSGAPVIENKPVGADFNGVEVSLTDSGNWSLGSPDAKVVIEEFSDMQCPFCGYYFADTFPKIFSNYIATGKVRYVYYNFPLKFHQYSRVAAAAALCAGEEGKFWQMHEKIMNSQSDWETAATLDDVKSKMIGYAMDDLKMDADAMDVCLAGDAFESKMDEDYAVGLAKGVEGTPSFFINGRQITGAMPYESFEASIEAAM
jgi:protein-disulfide isomerase